MSQKHFFRVIMTSMAGLCMSVLLPSCSDDHFDVNDGGGAGGNATLTLWQQLSQRDNLSNFAAVVERTPYFKDESHPSSTYTLKDVLNGTQVFTVFAPTNEAFTDAQRDRMLEQLEAAPYDVYLSLVANHIASHRYNATGTGEEEFVTVNGKSATFDRAAKTFRGIALAESNIPATNGVLHTIATLSPFEYNIYEYIKVNGDVYGELRKWIMEHDTIYFNANASVEGGSDRDGNPIYVDSVYYRTNTLFTTYYGSDYEAANQDWLIRHKVFGANLEAEDSLWAIALPTDAAWHAAYDAMKDHYNYASTYVNKYREDTGNTGETFDGEQADGDSLQSLSLRMDLASCLVFNARLQPRQGENTSFWNAETFQATPMPKMFNTRNDTIILEKEAVSDVKPFIFDNNSSPVIASNGLIYPISNWNFDKTYNALDLEIKITHNSIFQYDQLGTTSCEQVFFTNATSALVTDSLLGSVYRDYFYYISNGNGKPTVNFKLIDTEHNRQVMSNLEYEIGFVMVPDFYRADPDSIVPATRNRDAVQQNVLRARIFFNNGALSDANADRGLSSTFDFTYSGTRVDTIWVNTKGAPMTIKFPYSYKNITRSYPTMSITSNASNANLRSNYQHAFSIDRIILRAKRDSE